MFNLFQPDTLIISACRNSHTVKLRLRFSAKSVMLPIRAQVFVESMFSTNLVVLSIRAHVFVESRFSTNFVLLSIRAQFFVESMFSTNFVVLSTFFCRKL